MFVKWNIVVCYCTKNNTDWCIVGKNASFFFSFSELAAVNVHLCLPLGKSASFNTRPNGNSNQSGVTVEWMGLSLCICST